jgi:23S rRNA (uracil1939-C5)-methyltransferase
LASFSEPTVRLSGVEVRLPPSAFLQPTAEGELFLQSYARSAVKGAKRIADLFAGCGTLSFAVAQVAPVHAVELDPVMLGALVDAARKAKGLKKITAERRNLFRQPLAREELSRFDTVILDPPRAGAEAQARELAGSGVRRILYVSCDPQSFARDAAILLGGGYTASAVTPVDQFIWSEHIELVALFEAGAGGPPKSTGP